MTTLAALDAELEHRWFSFRSFELTDAPGPTPGLATWLAALPAPAPLTDDERAWLQANDGATSWSGEDFVRLSRLRARRPLGAEVYQQRTQALRELGERCHALGLRAPNEHLAALLGPSKLESIVRTRLDSLCVTLGAEPLQWEPYPGIAVTGVLADVQATGFWSLLLDRTGEHRVAFSFHPLVDDPMFGPATPTANAHLCAPTLEVFLARLLADLGTDAAVASP